MPIDLNEHLKKKQQSMNNKPESNDNEPPRWKPSNNDNNNGGFGFNGNFGLSPKFITTLIVIFVLVFLFITAKPFITISSGEVGIKVDLGAYQEKPLEPGLHFFIPIIQKIIIVDARIKTLNFTGEEDMERRGSQSITQKAPIQVRDKLGLDVGIELTIKYQIDREQVARTISNYTESWDLVIINPAISEVVGSVIGNYHAEDLPNKRDVIAKQISENFNNKINAIEHKPVRIESVELRKIILPSQVKDKIEQVQVAKQEAEKAIQEARAMRERAQGKADAEIIEANGKAKANRVISDSLSQKLLELRQIETQGKFNDALKENKDAQIFLTPGGAVPNIWVDSKNPKINSSIK